jgi:hypothetical protein
MYMRGTRTYLSSKQSGVLLIVCIASEDRLVAGARALELRRLTRICKHIRPKLDNSTPHRSVGIIITNILMVLYEGFQPVTTMR